jgi:APA family basic amino acid/polyamine antiporter
LRRELGLGGATLLGLGSILGTGVIVSLGLVTGLAGSWTPLVVLAAALVAACNALSTAQLAAAYPRSGGTYEYGYRLLHPLAGFTAGWMFLCAKIASAAAAALGFSGYLLSLLGFDGSEAGPWLRWVAAALVGVLAVLVAGGLRRSSLVNTWMVAIVVLSLAAFVLAGFSDASEVWAARWRNLLGLGSPASWPETSDAAGEHASHPIRALFEATALMFVAYTGYGRVATLGEEVRNPTRTIPRAIIATLIVSAVLYLAVAFVCAGVSAGDALSKATEMDGAPLEFLAKQFGVRGLPELVALGALTSMAGVLLNLLLGLSRVLFAMGRRGDMPEIMTRVDAKRSSPVVAVGAVGGLILLLTVSGAIKDVWSFSAFTVLVYYSLTNLAALRLPKSQSRFSRVWPAAGLLGCASLAFWVEPRIWLTGLCVLAIGVLWHLVARRRWAALNARG